MHRELEFSSAAVENEFHGSRARIANHEGRSSNRVNILGNDQDVDLFEQALDPFFELAEEFLSFTVGASDNFYFYNILDDIDTAISPSALIGRSLGAHGPRSEDVDQLFANSIDFFRFDPGAIVIRQWQIDLVPFHAAYGARKKSINYDRGSGLGCQENVCHRRIDRPIRAE
jgi:hypothetical protein